ncbi:hypothetical protein P7K49_024210 [Saguinus oedipus]|uniref:Uncharacterized protein n=1 Tax=Saguinus oedipus TaxID=9490 RepID=A0ABQ9UNW4_SAGOE|nr:hypothetical protein P7K49_024210 [Saguinus oedipus]
MEPLRLDRESHAQALKRPTPHSLRRQGDAGVGGAGPHLPGRWLRKGGDRRHWVPECILRPAPGERHSSPLGRSEVAGPKFSTYAAAIAASGTRLTLRLRPHDVISLRCACASFSACSRRE